MSALVGTDGSVLWLVAVLVLLTAGLGAALLAATRDRPAGRQRMTRRF